MNRQILASPKRWGFTFVEDPQFISVLLCSVSYSGLGQEQSAMLKKKMISLK